MSGLLEFLQEYVDQLADLTTPVKSKINSLTMLAAEEAVATPAAAQSIAAAIEKRINMVIATLPEPTSRPFALPLPDGTLTASGSLLCLTPSKHGIHEIS